MENISKRKKAYSQCAFCSNPPNSHEHLSPKWLKPWVEEWQNYNYNYGVMNSVDQYGNSHILKRQKRFTGDALSRRVRVVCKSCNEGWMSTSQEKAKPHLVPYLNGEWPAITMEAAKTINLWAAMTVMVDEFRDIHTMAITQKAREDFAQNQTLPPGWRLWVGRHKGLLWKRARVHFGLPSKTRRLYVKEPTQVEPTFRRQTTFFVIGELIIYAYSDSLDEFSINKEGAESFIGLRQLYPDPPNMMHPPDKIYDDYDLDDIAISFLEGGVTYHRVVPPRAS